MEAKFEQFIKERKFLTNVTPATVEWYRQSLAWLPNPEPSAEELKQTVLRMRDKNLKATGCNCRIRAINAYLKWSGSALQIPKLREAQLVLPVFTPKMIEKILGFKPRSFGQKRMQLLMFILLDTGCRISEALDLKVADCDLENLLVTLRGKGRKERKVPFSLMLRKALFRHVHDWKAPGSVLATRQGAPIDRHNIARDVKKFCRSELGFEPPIRTLHAFRHTFAFNYVRKGGSVFHLQKILGHTSLEMTRKYVNLLTEDLQAVHQKLSLLA